MSQDSLQRVRIESQSLIYFVRQRLGASASVSSICCVRGAACSVSDMKTASDKSYRYDSGRWALVRPAVVEESYDGEWSTSPVVSIIRLQRWELNVVWFGWFAGKSCWYRAGHILASSTLLFFTWVFTVSCLPFYSFFSLICAAASVFCFSIVSLCVSIFSVCFFIWRERLAFRLKTRQQLGQGYSILECFALMCRVNWSFFLKVCSQVGQESIIVRCVSFNGSLEMSSNRHVPRLINTPRFRATA